MSDSVCFLFRGDIRYDTRLANMARSYADRGWNVTVIQGCDEDRNFLYDGASVKSFRNAERGIFGFVKFWIRASQLAGRVAARSVWAADLYSLPVAVWRARAAGAKSGYDSRELFAHLGALKKSPAKQKFWYALEKLLIGRADMVITSGEMDSDYIEERYHVRRPHVVRNLPRYVHLPRSNRLREELHIAETMPVCLYQGMLFEGRGVLIMLELAELVPDAAFVFIGDGPLAAKIHRAAEHQKNIFHIPKVPREALISYAASATIGFALIEPITLSYLLALPNKLFEYIMAGTPVIASFAPQMEKIVEEYNVGTTVPFDCMGDIVGVVRQMLDSAEVRAICSANCLTAAKTLCWENEESQFILFAHTDGLM